MPRSRSDLATVQALGAIIALMVVACRLLQSWTVNVGLLVGMVIARLSFIWFERLLLRWLRCPPAVAAVARAG